LIADQTETYADGLLQVHVAPVILVVDRRARQVFRGFSGFPEDLLEVLRSRFSGRTVLLGDHDGDLQPREVDALAPDDIRDLVVVVPSPEMHAGGVAGLRWVVDRLLGPGGCPWDQAQTHQSLTKCLVEECYELIEAIDAEDGRAMREELGDVLLQPVMHAQMEWRDGAYDIESVADEISAKLVRRHPHVFDTASAKTADEVLANWDRVKKEEKLGCPDQSILSGVPVSAPALVRALEISKRAARAGFEWPDFPSVWEKFEEETREVKHALATQDSENISAEFGDLLFTVVNLARWAGVDPEQALRGMLNRFTRRFESMESKSPVPLVELDASEWDRLWEQAKADLG